jgi:hypothetical protein
MGFSPGLGFELRPSEPGVRISLWPEQAVG